MEPTSLRRVRERAAEATTRSPQRFPRSAKCGLAIDVD
jgi:hypothetical protein